MADERVGDDAHQRPSALRPDGHGLDDGGAKAGTLGQIFARRVGEPADAARLVAFLASDQAAWITGQVIRSEDGFLRS